MANSLIDFFSLVNNFEYTIVKGTLFVLSYIANSLEILYNYYGVDYIEQKEHLIGN